MNNTDTGTTATRTERVPLPAGRAISLAATPAVGCAWVSAMLWTVLSGLAPALHAGFRGGDFSALAGAGLALGNEDDERARRDHLEWSTRSGDWVDLQVRARHEALMRDSEPFAD